MYRFLHTRMVHLPDDLKAAARIRDAALASFAEHGVAATTIRGVATAAGVSPSLVQHHFGTKSGLRAAVDAYVIDQVTASFGTTIEDGAPEDIAERAGRRITDFIAANPIVFRYLVQALLAGDDDAVELFRFVVRLSAEPFERLSRRGIMHRDLDIEWAAIFVVFVNFAPVLLEHALDELLGHGVLTDAGLERFRKATTAMFTQGLFTQSRNRARDK